VLWNDSRAKEMERVLTQRIAPERYRSITGMPVVLLQYRECTVLGASILGAVGCGYFASIHEAVQSMVKVGRTVEPDPATADIYTQLFEIFRFCYDRRASIRPSTNSSVSISRLRRPRDTPY
jgi:ribulose kinase